MLLQPTKANQGCSGVLSSGSCRSTNSTTCNFSALFVAVSLLSVPVQVRALWFANSASSTMAQVRFHACARELSPLM